MAASGLSYDSTKSVIKGMGPNERIALVNRCPSLSTVEKLIPLHIKSLVLNELGFTINNTKYAVGVITKRKEGHKKKTAFNQNDVDKYDFKEVRKPADSTPDEIRMESRQAWTAEQHNLELQKRFDCFMLKRIQDITTRENAEQTPQADTLLKNVEERLFSHSCRIGETETPYNHYIRLYVSTDGKNVKKEDYLYNKSVYEFMKSLVFKVFGGRNDVSVDTLKIDLEGFHRYPATLKLKVKKLIIINAEEKANLNSLQALLDPSCFPLKSISIDESDDLNQHLLQQCEELRVRADLPKLAGLTHPRILFMPLRFPVVEFRTMLEDWQVKGKEIGTFYSISGSAEHNVKAAFDSVAQMPGARVRNIAWESRVQYGMQIIVSINNYTEAKFFCKVKKGTNEFATLNIKVQASTNDV